MEKQKSMRKLIEEAEKISGIDKCLTCQCFYDVLMEMMEALERGEANEELKRRLNEVMGKSKITHDCLGCDPCIPVPISNLLHEIEGGKIRQSCTCGPVGEPIPTFIKERVTSWPIEQGEYIVGNLDAPVAICTLVYPKKNENRIYLEHYKKDGTLNDIIHGENPVFIASTAIDRRLVSRLDHAAYLGREIEKAYLSMIHAFPYVQDSAPGDEDNDEEGRLPHGQEGEKLGNLEG